MKPPNLRSRQPASTTVLEDEEKAEAIDAFVSAGRSPATSSPEAQPAGGGPLQTAAATTSPTALPPPIPSDDAPAGADVHPWEAPHIAADNRNNSAYNLRYPDSVDLMLKYMKEQTGLSQQRYIMKALRRQLREDLADRGIPVPDSFKDDPH